jgi:23S rRNA (guanosine2251-2'-O)-methyltransferase
MPWSLANSVGCKLNTMDVLYGIHAVEEALRARNRPLDHIEVARERHDQRLQVVIDLAREQGVSVRFSPRDQLDRLARSKSHQGIVAVVASKSYSELDELFKKKGEHTFVVVLDGIEDPHNLGALIRTADGAGADGVIIPERRAATVNATVTKTSAGASEHVRIARVVNVARTLDELKQKNVWIVGLDERGEKDYDQLDYNMDCAVVLGAEGHGLHDLVRKKCDYLVSIPMMGRVSSLNVSVAGAVVMYEVARQRRSNPMPHVVEASSKKRKGLGS